jgi:phosphohistidine phosphatase
VTGKGEGSHAKLLVLVRHAKSSWKEAGLADRERPLSGRGRRDAPRMGRLLAARGVRPELLVTSPALRARQTAEALAEALGRKPADLWMDKRIYLAEPEELLALIRGFEERFHSALLVGHNPGLTELVNRLAGCEIENVPTCGIAILDLATKSWSAAGDRPARLLEFLVPKESEV